jgi:hypothetical protein
MPVQENPVSPRIVAGIDAMIDDPQSVPPRPPHGHARDVSTDGADAGASTGPR